MLLVRFSIERIGTGEPGQCSKKYIFILFYLHFLKKKMISRTRGAGEKYYSSANSRTNSRTGTSEAAIGSSRREDSYELLRC